MLRTAVETKLLPTRQHDEPIAKSVDIIEDEGESSDDEADKDSEEENLEKLVFGSCRDLGEPSHVKKQRKASKRKTSECDVASDEDDELPPLHVGKKPAWQDEDDNDIPDEDKEVRTEGPSVRKMARKADSDHLRKKYTKIMGVPKWAEQTDAEKPSDDEEDDEILRKATRFVGDSKNLPSSTLQIHKCTPLAFESRENSVLKSVEFHPNSQVALVAGLSGTATICQVDGKTNAKIQAVHFDRFPIYCAHFSHDGREIWAGSSQKDHMFCYDMMAGKTTQIRFPKGLNITNTKQFYVSPDGQYFVVTGRFGEIHVVSAKSKECLYTLKMNKQVKSVAFTPNGSSMYTIGGSDICIWDMDSRRCQHRFTDHGCIDGLSLAASPNGQFLASGSDSGVVNVYETSKLLETRYPAPLKEIMNLTTEVTHLKFNCTSELLAMSSSFKPNAVKMVHFPSLTAFSNFPGKHDFRYSNCIDISPNSGYFLCGNNLGTAHLFRLKHYSNF
ncbi:U3 small nucleolar RNA-associated protein 18 homolog [Rhipicephalus sanguineus]|uniref:U3 small nucleolar RNA-associated protein 18 homolog n=1 Tax=Rhipicephalus sanguineus TaxID=34632 RepID=UPI0020C501E4|nr:U3 small nucleolar RNA-associated protein 18 homolog [Rhipicephalus sanguineus]XP_049268304.1 U3 small nucleolar RNA-associated protein 18 homolog [Rhipicephalus sanguineus]